MANSISTPDQFQMVQNDIDRVADALINDESDILLKVIYFLKFLLLNRLGAY